MTILARHVTTHPTDHQRCHEKRYARVPKDRDQKHKNDLYHHYDAPQFAQDYETLVQVYGKK